jgi:iron complex transport system substrate-binding protein
MRLRLPIALVAATTLLLAGCNGDHDPGDTGAPPPAAAGFPVTVGELTLDSQPSAIVSLSTAATEMLFAIDAGDQVVAVDEFSNYPPQAPTTDLSGFTPNVEAIASYDPDLVVISYDPGGLVDQLRALDIPVHVSPDNPSTLDDIYQQITDLGALTGRASEAADLVQRMSDEIDKLVADTPDRTLTYYVEIDDTPWAYTSQSIISTLFGMVGLENIVVSDNPGEASMQVSPEFIVDANPDLIFLANAQYGVTANVVAARDGWGSIAAVQHGNVVELSPDIASRWGPRVVDLLREVIEAVSQVS